MKYIKYSDMRKINLNNQNKKYTLSKSMKINDFLQQQQSNVSKEAPKIE